MSCVNPLHNIEYELEQNGWPSIYTVWASPSSVPFRSTHSYARDGRGRRTTRQTDNTDRARLPFPSHARRGEGDAYVDGRAILLISPRAYILQPDCP
jgi:hypothetical protein